MAHHNSSTVPIKSFHSCSYYKYVQYWTNLLNTISIKLSKKKREIAVILRSNLKAFCVAQKQNKVCDDFQ